MRKHGMLLACVALMASAAPATAQVTNRATGQNNPCAQGRATVGTGQDGAQAELKAPNEQKGQSLSEHLAKSGGVICPPDNVDPAIKADTPAGGKMPVIPPPGTPQNQPNVQPK